MDNDDGHPLRDGLSSQAMEPRASPPKASIPDAGLLEITDIKGFCDALGGILKPKFDEQDAVWAEHGDAAMQAFAATGAELVSLGGNCPVQGTGDVDGHWFYFRARGDEWQFHVAATDAEIFDNDIFYHEEEFGEGFDAGWMHRHEALGCIVKGIGLYRAAKAMETGTAKTEGLGAKHDSAVAKPFAQGADS